MNEETTKLIRELADKLGTTVEHLWGALLRQAVISGIATLIFHCLLLLVFLTLTFYFIKWSRWLTKEDEWDSYGEGYWPCLIVASIGLFVWAVNLPHNIAEIISCFKNPEYWAMKELKIIK